MNNIYENLYKEFVKLNSENPLSEIINFYNSVYNEYYSEFTIDYKTLYLLKDLIWYNLELNVDYKFGLQNFNTLGSKFKIINQLDNNLFLNIEESKKLYDELIEIKNKWNNDWNIVHIYTDNEELNNKKVTQVICYKKGENPRKYNYYKKTTIIDEHNNNIYMNKDVMLCEVDGKLGEYSLNHLLYDKLIQLIEVCNSEKNIIIKIIG